MAGPVVKKLLSVFNALIGRDPRRNPDGTMTTRHGNRIIPYRVTAGGGSIRSNLIEFMRQPRVRELQRQLEPLLKAGPDEKITVNPDTGSFYLASDIRKNGMVKATVLGQIDLDLEKELLDHALQLVMMHKLFRGASPENPIILDEVTGRVYPKNDPGETRGHVKLGPKVMR
ncbi:MAG: hypothetical protein H6867_10890 [Rhodospirillales bacterium]|nr:hypothetical protein [Rhodospirillales bacterium]MCB9996634.1 hypothetical protein [Rhodospirillales bacterium]